MEGKNLEEKIKLIQEHIKKNPLFMLGASIDIETWLSKKETYEIWINFHYRDDPDKINNFETFINCVFQLMTMDENKKTRVLSTLYRASIIKHSYWMTTEEKRMFQDVEMLNNHKGEFAKFLRWLYV